MKKNDLMNGDIVVMRSGLVAVVIGQGNEAYLLFQKRGFEFLDDYYDDNMVYMDNEDAVMQVFRPDGGFGFEGVDHEVPIYERDDTWVRPTDEEMAKAAEKARAEYAGQLAQQKVCAEKNKENRISIITQAFYGNRTGTEIHKENIDRFILGHLDDFPLSEPVDRTIVSLPGSDNVVLIYNKYQEAKWLENKERALREDNYVIKPLATIPELNLEIYSRCIACRMNSDGEFESICEEDFEILGRYLAM